MNERMVIPFGEDFVAEWVLDDTWDHEKREWVGDQWVLRLREFRCTMDFNEADQDALAAIIAARPSREEANRKGKADEEGQA